MANKKAEDNEQLTKDQMDNYLEQMRAIESNKHKSEAVRYMFEPDKVIKRRMSRLNLKEIVTFANWGTLMAMLDPKETRMAPEIWMDLVLDFKISEGGKGRLEGQNVFEMIQESKETEDAFKA